MIKHVFIDLDGVLADFHTSAMRIHGRMDALKAWPPGEWDIEKVVGCTVDEFWKKIDDDHSFWPWLEPTAWKDELLAMSASFFDRMSFLTSPSRHPLCFSGKRAWAIRHLPENANLILCKTKDLIAREDRLLIDDSDKNVKAWEGAGGKAILFPRMWNALHEKSAIPMVHVGMELQRLLSSQITDNVKLAS